MKCQNHSYSALTKTITRMEWQEERTSTSQPSPSLTPPPHQQTEGDSNGGQSPNPSITTRSFGCGGFPAHWLNQPQSRIRYYHDNSMTSKQPSLHAFYRLALFLLAWPWMRRRTRKMGNKTLRLVELPGSRGSTGKVNFLEHYGGSYVD